MNQTEGIGHKGPLLEERSQAAKILLSLVVISGLLLVTPLFFPRNTPGFVILAIALFLPYLAVCWRLLRYPEGKEGPALAAGIGAMFMFLAALGCAAMVEQRDYSRLAYFGGLGLTHGLLAGFGFFAFKQGRSQKPAWRIVVRSILDPVVYYGVVFLIALSALTRH